MGMKVPHFDWIEMTPHRSFNILSSYKFLLTMQTSALPEGGRPRGKDFMVRIYSAY